MRILDHYILHSIIKVFISTILVFMLLYILIDAGTNLDDFFSNKVPFLVILQYYLNFLPVIFVQTSPIACLLASLFTYSGLNNYNEIIVLRASGLNFWKITRPAIVFSIVVGALIFLVNEKFVPQATSMTQELKSEKIKPSQNKKVNQNPHIIKNLFFYGRNNRLFFVDEFNPKQNSFRNLTIIAQDQEQRMTEKIIALKGEWTGSAWKLQNCQITKYNPLDQSLEGDAPFFKETILNLGETPKDFLKQQSHMNIKELRAYLKRLKRSGAVSALNNLKVDLHERIAYPFITVIILFTGLPFALLTGRGKSLTFASIGVALAIGFLFYVINAVGLALGKSGVLFPLMAAWIAPLIFIASGYYLMKKLF